MINWKVRIRQKWFWLTLIPLLFLLADQLAGLFGLVAEAQAGQLYDGALMQLAIALVGTVFAILALVGLPVDTTTEGYGDSARALTYVEPAPNASYYGLQTYLEQSGAADAKMVDWGDDVPTASLNARELAEAAKKADFSMDGAKDADR